MRILDRVEARRRPTASARRPTLAPRDAPRAALARARAGQARRPDGAKTSFYYSFLVLPAEQRRAIIAVWDFCRAVDDAVDEAPGGAGAAGGPRGGRLLARRAGALLHDGARRRPPQGRAPAAVHRAVRSAAAGVRGCHRRRGDGSRHDALRRPSTICFEYCRRVASAVGLICIRIFGCREPQAPRVRAESRRRAAADQHPARRQGRSRARPRLSAARGSRGVRLHGRRSRRAGARPSRCAGCSRSSAAGRATSIGAPSTARPAGGPPPAGRGRDHAGGVLRDAAAHRAERLRRVFGASTRVPRPRQALIALQAMAMAGVSASSTPSSSAPGSPA